MTLSGVTDSLAQVLPNTAVSVNMLIGDVNSSKSVVASDIAQVKTILARCSIPVISARMSSSVAESPPQTSAW